MNKPGPVDVLVVDSVTRLDRNAHGRVAIAASHGGRYSVHLALRQGVCALIVCDAGIGLERAGIAGLDLAQRFGVPCAATDGSSARIGDGVDCAQRGIISFANLCAVELGVRIGMPVTEAASTFARLWKVPSPDPGPLPIEARSAITGFLKDRPVVLIDSASLVTKKDRNAVVITGSHGGLLGSRPETAIKFPVFAALYNDAGVGCDRAGISRLPALDARDIAAATVAADSAQIGDAHSSWNTGRISHVNQVAWSLNGRPGQSVQELVTTINQSAQDLLPGSHKTK